MRNSLKAAAGRSVDFLLHSIKFTTASPYCGCGMGIFCRALYHLSSSMNSKGSLYSRVASALGFDSGMEVTMNHQNLCPCEGAASQNQSDCVNTTCYNSCLSLYTDLGTVFASFSYLLLLISSIQLILVMVHSSFQEDKRSRWRMAFRVTIQKCLLGAVILATGSRAIYYTVQGLIPDRWGDILLNVYYPSLLSAFSLLICFWAEFFYTSSNLEGQDFLNKHQYSVTYLAFNVMVYLLLVADIIATPLISEQEQVRMSGIVGSIFAGFLFMTLVGFLHFSIRLFFRPDWQPLFVQLAVLRINLRQQLASVLGVVSNAVMLSLIISLLVFNMVVRYVPVNSYSLYVSAVVIRVTELIMPLWFCCSLWNFKQPKRLWILNPGLILKQEQPVDDLESKPLLSSRGRSGLTQYETLAVGTAEVDAGEDGCCWVCLGNDDPDDLFYPCNCQLHRKCIKQWVAKRASDVNVSEKEYMKCQVCRKKYRVKKDGWLCFSRGMKRRHQVQLVAAGVFLLCSFVGLVLFGVFSPLDTSKKALVICGVAIFEAVVVKLLAIRMALVLRRTTHMGLEIRGYTVDQWNRRKQKKMEAKDRLGRSYSCSSSQASSEGVVHFNPSQEALAIDVPTGRSTTRTISVDVSP